MDVRRGRYLADHISSARLVELPGHNFDPLVGDQERLFSELEAFLANVRDGGELVAEPDRVLATVLFTDIVDATAHAADLGDRAWRKLLEEHHNIVRSQLSRFRGREMDTAGDGFFATFDGRAGDSLRLRDPRQSPRAWPGDSRGAAYWRLRAGRWQDRGYRGPHRRSGRLTRGSQRCPGLEHGQGSRSRIGDRFRGPRTARAQRHSG